jgi:hypothetical protein
MSEMIKKKKKTIDCLQETRFKYKDTCRLKVNEWSTIYHANTNPKKSENRYANLGRIHFRQGMV